MRSSSSASSSPRSFVSIIWWVERDTSGPLTSQSRLECAAQTYLGLIPTQGSFLHAYLPRDHTYKPTYLPRDHTYKPTYLPRLHIYLGYISTQATYLPRVHTYYVGFVPTMQGSYLLRRIQLNYNSVWLIAQYDNCCTVKHTPTSKKNFNLQGIFLS